MQPQFKQFFTSFVDTEGKIYAQQGIQNSLIGYTIEKYKELESMVSEAIEKADSYKQKLIEAGILKPQLTQEEQIAELSQQVSSLTSQVSVIASLLTGLNNQNNIQNDISQSNVQSKEEKCNDTAKSNSIPSKDLSTQKLAVDTKNRTSSKSG